MNSAYEDFGLFAQSLEASTTQKTGRYDFQSGSEGAIVEDISKKLLLNKDDSLLDVGCGPGLLLKSLRNLVATAQGIDHPNFVGPLTQELLNTNVKVIAGDFMDLPAESIGRFRKILIYSVIQYLPSEDAIWLFIDKALSLLEPEGGLILIGDVPNESNKEKFLSSKEGQNKHSVWREQVHGGAGAQPQMTATNFAKIDDHFVIRLLARLRATGLRSFLLPQPSNLPFGHTREDILIYGRSI